MWPGRDAEVEEEEEDPPVSNSPEAVHESARATLDRRPHLHTGTISKGGTRETVGLFVTANRYE